VRKRLLSLALVFLTLANFGCAAGRWSKRHPVAAGLIIGAGVGVGVGLATRRGHCPSVINGYPYNGTPPCPGPTYDPNVKK